MKTKNKRLNNTKENQNYYSKSDGNYLDINYATKAHQVLDRVAFAREWIHKLGSRYHLDFGCKDGYLDLTLASEGINCIGIDPSVDAIEEGALRAKELDVDNVTFKVGTVENFDNKYRFDTVSMLEVIEHVIDPLKVVEKLAQCGNFVIISTPDASGRHGMKDSEQNEEHLRLYTQRELEALCSRVGEIVESIIRDDQLLIVFKSQIL